jgi:FixJ family two-component response regulator
MTRPVVYVVDDDESLRVALSRLLTAENYDVRTYASAGEFLVTPPTFGSGCVVLDLHMPGASGLELQQALERYAIRLPIVFLTGRGDVASSVRAMKAGASDFLVKPVEPTLLLKAVETALARQRELVAQSATAHQATACYALLTERERAVFTGVVAGRLNKQIAGDLGITERTVKMHRAQVMAKMNVGSLAELVRLADLLASADASRRAADPAR